MDLNDRKRKILQAIIDEYISTAEPVGSRAISKKQELGLSSATIRNEMADLEELGYLMQPHTSAGRIPSDEGYRFYVNSLMGRYQLGMEAIERLQTELESRVNQLEFLIRKASLIASALTDYTSVVSAPEQGLVQIQKLDLISLGYEKVMLIVVTRTGLVRSQIINVDIDDSVCLKLTAILNNNLSGLTADEIDFVKIQELQKEIETQLDLHPRILINILNFVYQTVVALDSTEIYVDNAKSILKYPEYSDVEKAREMFSFLEDQQNLHLLLKKAPEDNGEGIQAKIGSENDFKELKDCSLVTVNYSLGDRVIGKLGIIGPKRMDYAKVFASLDLISTQIDRILQLYIDGGKDG